VIASLAILALALPPAASAQSPGAAADDMFKRGVEAYRGGNYEKAADLFARAYALDPRPATVCNLALSYDKWGGHEIDAFQAYLKCAEGDSTGRYRAHAFQRARALRETLARSVPDAPASDSVSSEPAKAEPAKTEPAAGTSPLTIRPPSRAYLWASAGSAVLGATALTFGIVYTNRARDTADDLEREYGTTIPRGSDGERRLAEARGDRRMGIAFYITSGALGAAAATFLTLELLDRGAWSRSSVAVTPRHGGAVIDATIRF
jgi:hypothetical protein